MLFLISAGFQPYGNLSEFQIQSDWDTCQPQSRRKNMCNPDGSTPGERTEAMRLYVHCKQVTSSFRCKR